MTSGPDNALDREKFTWNSQLHPPALRFILYGSKSSEPVGEVDIIIEKRKMHSGSTEIFEHEIVPPSDDHIRQAEYIRDTLKDSSYHERLTAPICTVAYVKLWGIQKHARSVGVMRSLLREVIPALDNQKVEYVIGKYEGWAAQKEYGDNREEVLDLYKRLVDECGGVHYPDGMYWIPVKNLRSKYLPSS